MSLTAVPVTPAHAQAVPTLYELQGENIKVVYSTTSFDGTPRFNYQDKQQTLQFVGEDQIRTVGLEIGTLVTVTIAKTVDRGSTSFSLLLPPVNLGQSNQAKIVTNGITTFNRFNVITHLNQGQTKFYRITNLTGTAQAVQF
ncbi:hypothetical protein FD725_26225 [Nostoc sp. TCL26-01]|nr:hypothetical protein FD725_26225 [Nostoc sp. TCL26-01]